jgi:hypothetical protein
MFSPTNTRRWPRYPVDLPLRIVPLEGIVEVDVAGRTTEISEGGMALCAGISLQPGDPIEIEFQAPRHSRVTGVIRNRTGYYFGVEFQTPLAEGAPGTNDISSALHQKQGEIARLRKEIEVLHNLLRANQQKSKAAD